MESTHNPVHSAISVLKHPAGSSNHGVSLAHALALALASGFLVPFFFSSSGTISSQKFGGTFGGRRVPEHLAELALYLFKDRNETLLALHLV